ncbi:MAG: hypothetical protein ACREQX_14315 [Candidatus Binataceae bacterium]
MKTANRKVQGLALALRCHRAFGTSRMFGAYLAGATMLFGLALLGAASIAAAQTVTMIAQFKGGVRPNAVFNNSGFFNAARACTEQYPFAKFHQRTDELRENCQAKYMKAHGASAQALAFMRYAPVPAQITQVKIYSSAAVIYARMMWADASGGFALIGKSGQIVPMWEPPDFRTDPRFQDCEKGNPDLTLWATSLTGPQVQRLGGGGNTFIFTYDARTCHACANVCRVAVAYDFDYIGKFKRVRLFKVTGVTARLPQRRNIYHPPAG